MKQTTIIFILSGIILFLGYSLKAVERADEANLYEKNIENKHIKLGFYSAEYSILDIYDTENLKYYAQPELALSSRRYDVYDCHYEIEGSILYATSASKTVEIEIVDEETLKLDSVVYHYDEDFGNSSDAPQDGTETITK